MFILRLYKRRSIKEHLTHFKEMEREKLVNFKNGFDYHIKRKSLQKILPIFNNKLIKYFLFQRFSTNGGKLMKATLRHLIVCGKYSMFAHPVFFIEDKIMVSNKCSRILSHLAPKDILLSDIFSLSRNSNFYLIDKSFSEQKNAYYEIYTGLDPLESVKTTYAQMTFHQNYYYNYSFVIVKKYLDFLKANPTIPFIPTEEIFFYQGASWTRHQRKFLSRKKGEPCDKFFYIKDFPLFVSSCETPNFWKLLKHMMPT